MAGWLKGRKDQEGRVVDLVLMTSEHGYTLGIFFSSHSGKLQHRRITITRAELQRMLKEAEQ